MMVRRLSGKCVGLAFLLIFAGQSPAWSAEPTSDSQEATATPGQVASNIVALNPQKTVLLDRDGKRLLLKGRVCLREGLLEMFLCLAQTKEHESIIAIDAEAYVIHAGLLAIGAKPGHPVRFDPEYQPPTGEVLEIVVEWKDKEGTLRRRPAQDWVRHVTHRYFETDLAQLPTTVPIESEDDLRYDQKTKSLLWFGIMSDEERKRLLGYSDSQAYREAVGELHRQSQPREMKADWVFAGSGFSELPDGKRWYQAEGGNVICVANFGDAMIDVSVPSSASNDQGLMFEPYTERVPPIETSVTVILTVPPKAEAEGPDTGKSSPANE